MFNKQILQTIFRPVSKNTCYVYRIVSNNGSHYVGQTKNLERRLSEHEKGARRYGSEIVKHQILDICESSEIFKLEKCWINYYSQFPGNTNIVYRNLAK
jgi:hypothetical protein